MSAPSSTESRALALLASGITNAECAKALGVSESLISQFSTTETFVAKLAELRFEALKKNNARDEELDDLEDTLIEKIKQQVSLVFDPMKAAKLFQIINAAKRRGSSTPGAMLEKQTVIRLNMPVTLVQKFTLNGQNQIVQAGAQDLVTIQSKQMENLAKTGLRKALDYVQPINSPTENATTSTEESFGV